MQRRLMMAGGGVVACSVLGFVALGCAGWAQEDAPLPPISREPYVQLVTPNSIYIIWRTEWERIEPVVRFGLSPDRLDRRVNSSAITIKAALGKAEDTDPRVVALRTGRNKRLPSLHSAPAGTFQYEARLSGLTPNTRYYYAVFDGDRRLTPPEPSYHFVTAPVPGQSKPTRFWVVGDTGTARKPQYMVYQSALRVAAREGRPFDFILHVGDIAYLEGTDAQFQTRYFKPYARTLRHLVCWPTMSNHDGATSKSSTGTGPYFDAFVLPTKGEAGGVPSGMEAIYAFQWGRIHFICLDSFHLSRKSNDLMATWLKKDLAKVKADGQTDWLIAFFHHPAYSKGSHDGSRERELLEMRQWIQPILEAGGVDVVFNGHSHTYERTMLMDGCYGTNQTAERFVLDEGDGNPWGDGPYRKSAGINPREGQVTCVTGHGGMTLGRVGTLPMAVCVFTEYGSTIVDVDGDTLTATMINQYGDKLDCFQIVKCGKVTPVRHPYPWRLADFPPALPRTNAPASRSSEQAEDTSSQGSTQSTEGSETSSSDSAEETSATASAGFTRGGRRGGFGGFGGFGSRAGGRFGTGTNLTARPQWTDALSELPLQHQVLIPPDASWQYLAGAHPRGSAWRCPGFDATGWKTGRAAFGYKYTNNVLTPLPDMRGNYSVVYLRKEFVVDRPDRITELGLVIDYDDGFIAWLNGQEVARSSVDRGSGLRAQGVRAHDAKGAALFRFSTAALRAGTNVLAIEGHNQSLESSDFLLAPYLISEE
jgi:hypothetical protein